MKLDFLELSSREQPPERGERFSKGHPGKGAFSHLSPVCIVSTETAVKAIYWLWKCRVLCAVYSWSNCRINGAE